MTPSNAPNPTSGPALRGQTSNSSEYKPNWNVIVPIALISAVVLLVCLPVSALLIVNSTDCCLADGPEKIITFWASMIAGFLTLFGMLVTAVFIITAFRVDATARDKARSAARKEVWTYIEHYHSNLAEQIQVLEGVVEEMKADVTASGESAKQAFTEARNEVGKERDQASAAITRARNETTNAASEAQRTIDEARNQAEAAGDEAQAAIRSASQEVERQRDETIRVFDSARQGVEDAARAARDRIDRAEDPPQGGGGSD